MVSPQSYASSAKVQIPASLTPSNGSTNQTAADVATEVAVMRSQAVASRVARTLKSGASPDALLAKVSVSSPPDARVLVVTFTASKAGDAQRGAQAFADGYLAEKQAQSRSQLQAQIDGLQRSIDGYNTQLTDATNALLFANTDAQKAAAQVRINGINNLLAQTVSKQNELKSTAIDAGSVLQPAELPTAPAGPSLGLLLAAGLLLGLGAGVVVAFVRERLDEQVREPSDLQDVIDVPVLGSIPNFPERFRSPSTALVTIHAPEGSQADAFRRLRASMLIALNQHHCQVLAITSPSAGDGKSTIAANLAVTMSQSGRSVVLISADVRRPTLDQLFELDAEHPGLLDVLGRRVTFDEAVVPVGRFPVMASGRVHANPTDLLQSVSMEKLVADARSRFDLVIIDTPPVLAVADVLGLVPMIDAVLVVVAVDQTSEAEVAQARSQLDQAGATILGAVINRSADERGPLRLLSPERDDHLAAVARGDGAGQAEAPPVRRRSSSSPPPVSTSTAPSAARPGRSDPVTASHLVVTGAAGGAGGAGAASCGVAAGVGLAV